MPRTAALVTAILLVTAACSSDDAGDDVPAESAAAAALIDSRGQVLAPAPPTPAGPLAPAVAADLDLIVENLTVEISTDPIARLGASGDPRVAWFFSDLLRLFGGSTADAIVDAFAELTGVTIQERPAWNGVTNHLIAWDTPAPPGYRELKGAVFTLLEPRWAPFFEDADAAIDWRWVSWGGVFVDDRPDATSGQPCVRGCIPALDQPVVTEAAAGGWYPDDRIVFGVVVDGEARAYPKNIMEVHEMVNDTLGGRSIALPYCTLCGSAQAYFTDNVAGYEQPLLRTSGLLSRSNKVMYEVTTFSAFDTFTGRAVSGPMQESGVALDQASVVTTTWREWRTAHPKTTIIAEDGGIGREYSLDPLGGRDDDGPIFPVGDVDPRLGVQDPVLGVIAADGTPVAFPVGTAVLALEAGEAVSLAGVELRLDGGGLRALVAGDDAGSHEAFWFAWSQFHPDTLLWTRS